MAHEDRTRDAIRKALEARGAWCIATTRLTPGRHGVPDLLGCFRGVFFAIEVKKPEKRSNTSAEQRRELGSIERAGGWARVCTTVQEALSLLIEIEGATQS